MTTTRITAASLITLGPILAGTAGLRAQSPGVWFSGSGYPVFNDLLGGAPFGDTPFGVAAADFDGDGTLDLATPCMLTNNLTVFLGRPDGSFAALTASSFPAAGRGPRSVVAADFDNDGSVDLATGNSEAGTISILLGHGDGTFAPHADFKTGATPQGIAAGEFNGDGIPDLVTANYGSDDVSVLFGQGGGGFSRPSDFAVARWPSQLIVDDFNGDGEDDVAAATSEALSILLGRGDGTLDRLPDISAGFVSSLATGDFNGDGKRDLVIAHQYDGSTSVLLGNGDGTFRPRIDFATAPHPLQVAAADLNADGKLDFVTASERDDGCILCGGPLTLYLGNGDGTFSGPFLVGGGAYPTGIATGDFDLDGRIDLAITDGPSDVLVAFLQRAHVAIGPESLDFPLQRPGAPSAPLNVMVQDIGSLAVSLGSVVLAGARPDQFAITADDCSMKTIPSSGSCAVTVVFSPTTSGEMSASLLVDHDPPGTADTVTLHGSSSTANIPPSFTIAAAPPTVLEGAGPQSVPNFITQITPGPADESSQAVTIHVTGNSRAALFSTQPVVDAAGTLSYAPAPDAFGTSTITVVAQDDGGTAGGGSDASSPQVFTITVTGVNDAPTFVPGPNQTVSHPAGAQTIDGWATSITAGPDESGQTLAFVLTNDNNGLFTVPPALSSTGTLRYTPAPGYYGTATVRLTLKDDGGTENGGRDTASAQTFSIIVADFTIAAACRGGNPPCDGDAKATFAAGQSVGFEITGTPVPAAPYANPIVLACADLPAGAACSFTPGDTLDLTTGPQTVVLTIRTTGASAQLVRPFDGRTGARGGAAWLGAAPMAFLGLGWVGRNRNRRRPAGRGLALLAILLAASWLPLACRAVTEPLPGTPPGTHAVRLTARAGSLQHDLNITVDVR